MFSVDENGVLEVSASVSEENGATAKLVIEKEKVPNELNQLIILIELIDFPPGSYG